MLTFSSLYLTSLAVTPRSPESPSIVQLATAVGEVPSICHAVTQSLVTASAVLVQETIMALMRESFAAFETSALKESDTESDSLRRIWVSLFSRMVKNPNFF